MDDLAASLKLLADGTRLRILRLLAHEELNAGELAAIVGKGLPAISRQTTLLRDAGLVAERREGRYAFFSLAAAAHDVDSAAGWIVEQAREAPDDVGDLTRLADVLRTRAERQLAGDGEGRKAFVPGRSWRAWSRSISWLLPRRRRVVDLGCGEGALTLEIARFADAVDAVDPRAEQLRRAKARASKRKVVGVTFTRAALDDTGLPGAAFDLAVMSQTLHYADDPAAVLAEALRLLEPGGDLLVLDLLPHDEDWVRTRLGHRHQGFPFKDLLALVEQAGFTDVRAERMPSRPDDPFRVAALAARKPEVTR